MVDAVIISVSVMIKEVHRVCGKSEFIILAMMEPWVISADGISIRQGGSGSSVVTGVDAPIDGVLNCDGGLLVEVLTGCGNPVVELTNLIEVQVFTISRIIW